MNDAEINNFITALIDRATYGMTQWEKMVADGKVDDLTRVILFPSSNYEYNAIGLKYLDDYLLHADKNMAIFAVEKSVCDEAKAIVGSRYPVYRITQQEADGFLRWYEMCELWDRFVIVLLWEVKYRPKKVMEYIGCSAEELIKYGVYLLKDDNL